MVALHLKNQSSLKELKPWIERSVMLTRITRSAPKIKRGASIRAAISMMQIAESMKLSQMSAVDAEAQFWKITKSVLANRIELQVGKFSNHSYSQLLDEVIAELKQELQILVKKNS